MTEGQVPKIRFQRSSVVGKPVLTVVMKKIPCVGF